MMLIKDKKKHSQFRQMVTPQYTFQQSEEQFQCPRRRDGTIDRRYKSKCADEIAEEERLIGEEYYDDKDAYIASLKKIKKEEEKEEERAAANHPGELNKVDEIVHTNQLKGMLKGIRGANSPSDAKAVYENKKNSLNEFQRYILADAYLTKVDTICSSGTCDAVAGTWLSNTAAKFTDGREIGEDAQAELFQAGEDCKSTKLGFDPLVAGIFFDDFYTAANSGSRPIIPFKDNETVNNETVNNENVYTAFYREFLEEFTELWYSERKKKDWKMIPKNPFLFYFYLVDEENRQVLWDDFGDIIDSIKKFFASNDNESRQYNYMTDDHRYQGPDYDFEGSKEGFSSLDVFPYEKKKIVKSEPSDYSQGLHFTADGHAMFILFLGCVIKRSYEDVKYKDLTIRPGPRVHMFMQAYEWVVRKQEKKLLSFKEWVPYSFSAWGANGGFLPSFLHHTPQSMANLNIRLLGNRPISNACPQKYETYYGATFLLQNNERDPNKRNDRGLCTQFIDDLLNELGMNPEEERNNPWYVNWIGTWQQAERRLNAFKKKQTEMYDNGDPNYSFLNYMWNLLTLKLDYWVKKMFNVANVKVDDSGDELKELSEEETASWKETFSAIAGSLGGKIASGAKALGELLKIGGLLLYKLIGIVMAMPMVHEAIVKLVEDYMHKLCRDMAISENRVKIARTGSTGNVEEFDEDLGSWIAMPVAKQKEIAEKEATVAAKNRADKMSQFMSVLQQMSGSDGSSTLMKGLQGVELFTSEAFGSVIGLLEKIPGVSHVLATLGLTGDKLKGIVITGLMNTAQGTWNDIVMANRGVRKLSRLYEAVMNGMSNCTDSDNNLIIKDGGELGEGAQYCNFAWEKALFNVPYYAVMLLNEIEGKGIKYWDKENYALAKATAINKLINTTPVPGGEQAETPDNDAKREFRQKRTRLEKLLNDELDLYRKQKAMNDTDSDNYMHQSTSQFGNTMQAQLKARGERDRIAAEQAGKDAASSEERAAMDAEEKRLVKEREKIDAEQAKQLEEDQSSSMYWWGGALLVAVSVGLFVATGGASGVIQAAAAAAGTAASATAAAATAAATAAAAVGTAAAATAATVGAGIAAVGSGIAAVGSGIAASSLLSGALVSAVGAALKSIIDSPEMLMTLVLATSAIVYRGVQIIKEWGEHMLDGGKMILLDTIFKKQPLWKTKFKTNLNDRMETFASKEPNYDDVKMKGAELRMTIAKVRPITIIWQGVDCDFLNLDVCNKLFSVYGQAVM